MERREASTIIAQRIAPAAHPIPHLGSREGKEEITCSKEVKESKETQR
jgi:hypothetical protein